jgi:hypothetical protein
VNRSRKKNPIRTTAAVALLSLGGTLAWIGLRCQSLGERWAGASAHRAWQGAIEHFHDGEPRRALPAWEHHLLRIGPPVLVAIGGALVALWTLLLLGGALFWLALHGFGSLLLLSAVALGVILGSRLALGRRVRLRDRWN